jgi:hypothetical protein
MSSGQSFNHKAPRAVKRPECVDEMLGHLPSSGNQKRIFSGTILGSGKRFVMRADEKLTAFLELEAAIRACGELSWREPRNL